MIEQIDFDECFWLAAGSCLEFDAGLGYLIDSSILPSALQLHIDRKFRLSLEFPQYDQVEVVLQYHLNPLPG